MTTNDPMRKIFRGDETFTLSYSPFETSYLGHEGDLYVFTEANGGFRQVVITDLERSESGLKIARSRLPVDLCGDDLKRADSLLQVELTGLDPAATGIEPNDMMHFILDMAYATGERPSDPEMSPAA